MGLSETEVQKQLKHMIAFIEQEANEKAEEIDAKAEEEFNIEKGKLVQQQRTKIMEYYEKKEKQVELQRKIQSSNMLNQARLRVLKSREDHIKCVLDEARSRLARLASDPSKYESILRGLITSALSQMLEERCSLRCRQQDVSLVESLLPRCKDDFRKLTKGSRKEVQVSVDRANHLPPECAGGVELLAKDGKIRVDCALESRLELISHKMLPEVRTALFGTNPNRRFND